MIFWSLLMMMHDINQSIQIRYLRENTSELQINLIIEIV